MAFVVSFSCFVAFVVGLLPGRTVDLGPQVDPLRALVIDLGLLLALPVARATMATLHPRLAPFGAAPKPATRSTELLVAAAWLAFLVWGWRPLPEPVWQTESPWLFAALAGLCAFGWILAVWATFWIDHFELAGLRQVAGFWANRPYRRVSFQVEGAYRFVRHPMMLGVLLGLWATPSMTVGHLVLAAVLSAYVVVWSALEERQLAAELGEPYRRYLVRVPAFLPRLRPRQRGGLRRR
ncbi:MAG TPA: isoprenylcysteine carboxylmethyltransferase family protein [Thermoanaerobaculia bacterium]|nr:isoprenylcysteine carboxylmethyltransferase family protein [Thermoanaerobaculia bacterium]